MATWSIPAAMTAIGSLGLCLPGGAVAQVAQYRGPGTLAVGAPAGAPPAPVRLVVGVCRMPAPRRGGVVLTPDLSRWQFWWEFNKDRFLAIGDRPGLPDEVVDRRVVPLLETAIRSGRTDVVCAGLISLARSGAARRIPGVLRLVERRLGSPDARVREVAALTLGITGESQAVTILSDLVLDNARGRELTGRGAVGMRTRVFAAHGLGLVLERNADLTMASKGLSVLSSLLGEAGNRALQIAAIQSLGMLRLDPSEGGLEARVFDTAVGILERCLEDSRGADGELVQAHVPTAMARLLCRGGSPQRWTRFAGRLADELRGDGPARAGHDIRRSAVLAIGEMATVVPGSEPGELLRRSYETDRDQQTRHFVLIALGQAGGIENRNLLLDELKKGNSVVRPWAALALGVYGWNARQAGKTDEMVGQWLQVALERNRNPETLSALSIALGLGEYRGAAGDLRDLLIQNRHRDELAGYLCVGLALMDDTRSRSAIEALSLESERRPNLLQQSHVALGIFGDPASRPVLERRMLRGDAPAGLAGATAGALGRIGAVEFLEGLAADGSAADATLAQAITALGILASPASRPWNAPLAIGLNYRAAVETLTSDAGTGVLDIL